MSTTWAPPVTALRWDDTHRLIPDAYAAADEPILGHLADGDPDDTEALIALSAATNRRLLAQHGALPSGIHLDELVHGIPESALINAAFCYPHPAGSRFNGPDRGAWYAGREIETSLAEVAFHKSVELAETDWFDLEVVYHDLLADIHGPFHDLRRARHATARAALSPDSYVTSQALAARLLDAGSLGIVYPSVRHRGGEAVAVMRPALVGNARRGARYRLTWSGTPTPEITPLP